MRRCLWDRPVERLRVHCFYFLNSHMMPLMNNLGKVRACSSWHRRAPQSAPPFILVYITIEDDLSRLFCTPNNLFCASKSRKSLVRHRVHVRIRVMQFEWFKLWKKINWSPSFHKSEYDPFQNLEEMTDCDSTEDKSDHFSIRCPKIAMSASLVKPRNP